MSVGEWLNSSLSLLPRVCVFLKHKCHAYNDFWYVNICYMGCLMCNEVRHQRILTGYGTFFILAFDLVQIFASSRDLYSRLIFSGDNTIIYSLNIIFLWVPLTLRGSGNIIVYMLGEGEGQGLAGQDMSLHGAHSQGRREPLWKTIQMRTPGTRPQPSASASIYLSIHIILQSLKSYKGRYTDL